MTTLNINDGNLQEPAKAGTAANLEMRQVFRRKNVLGYFMRVKPTSYLLNSSVVVDSLNQGKPMILNLNMGTIHFISGDEVIIPVESATLKIVR